MSNLTNSHPIDANPAPDYARTVALRAPRERVYEAIAILEGIQSWWNKKAAGSMRVGGEFRVTFSGYFLLRIDRATPPSSVQWTCIASTEQPDWEGTQMAFDLIETSPDSCELRFRHIGLTPRLPCYGSCQAGWRYFLDSLAAYVEHGTGAPFTP